MAWYNSCFEGGMDNLLVASVIEEAIQAGKMTILGGDFGESVGSGEKIVVLRSVGGWMEQYAYVLPETK